MGMCVYGGGSARSGNIERLQKVRLFHLRRLNRFVGPRVEDMSRKTSLSRYTSDRNGSRTSMVGYVTNYLAAQTSFCAGWCGDAGEGDREVGGAPVSSRKQRPTHVFACFSV